MTDLAQADSKASETLDFRADLQRFLDYNDLAPEDCCIVGSVTLSIRDLRDHGDVDVCVAPSVRDKIEKVEEPIELAPNKYEHIGISDETIIYDEAYHDIVDGIKIVRPEIEYSHKSYRQWDKDKEDLELLKGYKETTNDWDSDLVVDDYSPSFSHVAKRGIRSLRRDGFRKTIEHGIEFLRRHGPMSRRSTDGYESKPMSIPARAVQSYRQAGFRNTIHRGARLLKTTEPTGLLQRYSHPRHKIKLATLVEEELRLKYDPADFIAAQYRGSEFVRYDLIVYLLTIEAYKNNPNSEFELYRRFQEIADVKPVDEFLEIVDAKLDADRLVVPIGYSSELLDPKIAAIALYENPKEIEVEVKKSGSSVPKYSIGSFENGDFTAGEVERVRSRYSRLLSSHGVLFEVVFWPPASDYFDEIIETLSEEERVHSCSRITLEKQTFEKFVYDVYATQSDVRWDYIDKKIERIGGEPSEILSVQVELPNPRIREQNSHEMKEIKERYRARYNPKIAPEDPNTRRTIHAADDYIHNRESRTVIEDYKTRAIDVEEVITLESEQFYP